MRISMPGRATRRRLLGTLGVGALTLAALAAPGEAAPAAPRAAAGASSAAKPTTTPGARQLGAGRYVVLLRAPSAATYAGGRPGLPATRATGGQQFRADSRAVRQYSAFLRRAQDTVADELGIAIKDRYTIASNGFAASLTAKQAMELSSDRRVLVVQRDTAMHLDTWNTPTFLGLAGKDGVWKAHGGTNQAGAGVVIGVLDSGAWPESKSFRGKALSTQPVTPWDATMKKSGATRMEKVDGSIFNGQCETGEDWTLADCSSKIIGARYYPDAFLADVPPEHRSPTEFISTRDGDGHGSHTASTAGGRIVDNVVTEGRKFGTVTGMAPGAALAIYKVCWEDDDEDTGGCYGSATLAAIDDAVTDGVDAINFSISGAQDTVVDAVEVAFEGAAEAGVFVATSAGNSGPTASTVAHNSPWLTTVAASTHVNLENTVVLGNGKKYAGASISGTPVASSPLILSTSAVAAGAEAADAALCGPDTLDDATVAGKIVVCNRGVYDRVAKSAEVARAGGKAMILVNVTPNSTDADFHSVPTIHLTDTDGAKVVAYVEAQGASAKASFVLGNTTSSVPPLPQIAGFSSRGPALANDGDLLKPDIAAPGASVLAAVAPPSNSGRKYDLYSGTSMASPHIAGLAAFILGDHPDWTPMQVKSAMMTTSKPLLDEDGKPSTDVFAGGSGQVQPKKFFDPGLFVTSNARDWQGFLSGQGLPTGVAPIAASQLNGPSIAQGAVTSSTVITRTFTSSRKGQWNFSIKVPGFTVKTSRPRVTATRAKDQISVKFTFTRTTAPLGEYAMGSITLNGPTKVRIPVALRPVSVDAPASVSGTGTTGSVDVPITAGKTGTLDVTPEGLTAGVTESDAVATGDFHLQCFTVDPGTTQAVFDLDAVDDSADLDLYVYASDSCDPNDIFAQVGESATGAADESVVIDDPDPGVYVVEIDGFEAGSQGDPIAYDMTYYGIGATPGVGNLTATPDPVPVVSGKPTSFSLSWSGLEPGTRYRGSIGYEDSTDTTLVEVSTVGQSS